MNIRSLVTIACGIATSAVFAQAPMPQMPPMPGMPGQQMSPMEQMQRRNTQNQAIDLNRGQRLYNTHCVSCHGTNGIPTVPNAPNFMMRQGLDKPDYELRQSLMTGTNMRTGRNHIPPYMGVVKDQEMLEIIQYIRIIR